VRRALDQLGADGKATRRGAARPDRTGLRPQNRLVRVTGDVGHKTFVRRDTPGRVENRTAALLVPEHRRFLPAGTASPLNDLHRPAK
jgi:hypothetical protein